MNSFFGIAEKNSTPGREVAAGLTTFLTMAYIIFVNPNMLSATGMDKGALITVTILASILGTLLAGLWGKVPYAMAPGMGLNAFFTYSLVLNEHAGITWQTALGVVFLSGIVFLVLTLVGVREKVVNAIPLSLRLAISAGIGLFITFIGLKNMGLVVGNPATLVSLGKVTPALGLALLGLLIMTILEVWKVRGSILIGIISVTILGFIFGEVEAPATIISTPPSIAPIFGQLDIGSALQLSLVGAIFSFMFVDLFDSVGTIVACSHQAGLMKEDGTIPGINKVLEADAVATVAGAVLGTSTTTTYIESGSGIAAGGRTGLTAVSTAAFFFLALFFTGLIGVVPGFATAPALVIVGVYMFKNIKNIDFADFEVAVPSFLAIILMPLTYSISTGLCFGFISYVIIAVAAGDFRKIQPTMWVIAALSALDLYLNMV